MARRSDHSKEEIKDMALTAAGKIVTSETYAGLSARKIAKEIGYTVGTLYLVFENLDDLILQVNVRTLNGLYNHLKQSIDNCREPRTCIIAMGRAYVEFATLYPERWKLIFEHTLPQDVAAPEWYRKNVASMFDLIEGQLQPLLIAQSKRKLIQTARTLWCGVHGICALAVTNKLENNDVESIQALTDSLINYFLVGLEQDIAAY
jgi:AcrR family transcriptional regulator